MVIYPLMVTPYALRKCRDLICGCGVLRTFTDQVAEKKITQSHDTPPPLLLWRL